MSNLSVEPSDNNLSSTQLSIILDTRKLLDFLIEFLQFTRPQTQFDRKKINDWLHRAIRTKNETQDLDGIRIGYVGQPEGVGKQHTWKVEVNKDSEQLRKIFAEIQRRSRLPVPSVPPTNNQGQNATFEWNGLFFRSPAEIKIAEALDRRNLLFFPNSRCRITKQEGIKDVIEVDFLVLYKGTAGILEVDGQTYHQSAAIDHQRDRLFFKQGILCSRFTAIECMEKPDLVVEEFLQVVTHWCK